MKTKLRLSEFRKQLVSGSLSEERPQTAQMISWMLNFLLGFGLAAVPLQGGCGPFGIAAVARAHDGLCGLMCLLGAALGYLSVFPFHTGIRFVAAALLLFACSFALQELKLRKAVFFMPALAAAVTLLTGYLGYYESEAGKSMILPLFYQTVLAFGCTYFFREALSGEERMTEAAELRHGISVIILLACLLMALSRAKIYQTVSLGRVLSILLVEAAAFRASPLPAAVTGLVLGLAMDASGTEPAFFGTAYAFCGLISAVFSRRGRVPFLLSFLLCSGLAVFCNINQGLRLELLMETATASVAFLLIPGSLLNMAGTLLKGAVSSTGETGVRRYTAGRLQRLSGAFQDLYTTVDACLSVPGNDENITKVFDRAADQVCSRCRRKTECWNHGYLDTLNVFNDATAQIRSRGIMKEQDLPKEFREHCLMPQELVGVVNGELRARMYRRQFQARLSENRSAAYQQYLDVSAILSSASEELENAFGPDLLVQRKLNRYLTSLDIDADIAAFRDKSGRLHILLESARLKRLMQEPGYLDRLSDAVDIRLCRPRGSDDRCEGRITLMEAEPLSVSVGVASVKKSGETVSGDRGTYFKTEQGVLCILLSDGMGSGESAAKESVAAVRILERFLRAGVEPAVAMKILNSVMLLKNESDWGFATVDLLCIDLFSGDAAFYKYGAAPSYVRAGKQIRRVRCETLAAGLSAGEKSRPDIVKMRLRPGNLALIASDGVLAETEDGWIRKLLGETDSTDMKALARTTLEQAMKQYGCNDGMTVLAVRVEQRG